MQYHSPAGPYRVSAETALGHVFEENAARIFGFIYLRIGHREAAEDLTSQVFLKAVRWLAEDRAMISVRAWLFTTARSTLVDYWREQGQLEMVPLTDGVIAHVYSSTDPRRERERRAQVEDLLTALPERERQVLRLRYLRGYTAGEIGQELGLTPGNVRVVQLRALRHAAQHLTTAAATHDPGVAHSVSGSVCVRTGTA